MTEGFFLGFACFAVSFLVYFSVTRLSGGSKRFFVLGLAAWFGSSVALLVMLDLPLGPKLILLITHTTLWVLALNFLAALANSVTLSILNRLVANGDRQFSLTEVKGSYHQADAVRGRIIPLVVNGLVTETNGTFSITPKGRLIERPLHLVKVTFGVSGVG